MSGEYRKGEKERTQIVPGPLSCSSESTVGFDIETTGIGPDALVTVACVWSPTKQAHCFYGEDPSPVTDLLDSAKYIYTFNGMEFDLPRFAKHCGRSMGPWAAKTVDPLYMMKNGMGFGACTKLNDLLHDNGYEPKSGSGLQAIEFWNNGELDALLSYCMDDSRLTYEICNSTEIKWAKRWIVRMRQAKVLDFIPPVSSI